jgi:UMF1 family MFS transporter
MMQSGKLLASRFSPRTEILAWATYDWANSAYSTLLITVVLHYIQQVALPGNVRGPIVFAGSIAVSMFLVAVLSPIVGALADANRSKRRWLAATALPGAGAAIALALVPTGNVWLVVPLLVAMNVLFDLAMVPYNGFLPEITDETSINRVSALGFAMGYLGGSIPLVLAAMVVYFGDRLGVPDPALQDRIGILLLGLWWGGFTLPVLWVLRDRGEPPLQRQPMHTAVRRAVVQVGHTLRKVRVFPHLSVFLVAYLIYNDGIQTVITQANTLSTKEFHFPLLDLCGLVLVIQLVALPSALLVGRLADRFGQKSTVTGCLTVWIGLLVAVMFIETKGQLWLLAVGLALVLGGTQAVSRAMMGLMTPAAHSAEFFGFFNLSGKAASFLGPAQFALVVWLTGGNTRWASLSLLVFFLAGLFLIRRVNVDEGRRQALESSNVSGH